MTTMPLTLHVIQYCCNPGEDQLTSLDNKNYWKASLFPYNICNKWILILLLFYQPCKTNYLVPTNTFRMKLNIATNFSTNLKKKITNYLVLIVLGNYTVQLIFAYLFLRHHKKRFSPFSLISVSHNCVFRLKFEVTY